MTSTRRGQRATRPGKRKPTPSATSSCPSYPAPSADADDAPAQRPSEPGSPSLARFARRWRSTAEHHPQLGARLDHAIRTGTYCVYFPDPLVPVAWRM